MKDIKILNFGSLNIDKNYEVEKIVKDGETISSTGFFESIGGKGLNQSTAIKKAGGKIYHAGLVGENDSKILLDFIKEDEINSLVEKVAGPSGHAIIQVDQSGNNAIIVSPGANGEISKAYVDDVLKNFDKKDFLVIQNEISNNSYIIEKAKEREMIIFLNPSPMDEKINDIDLSKIDYLFINESEAQKLTGRFDPEEIIGFLKTNYPDLAIILTLGDAGGVYAKDNDFISFDAYPTELVDSTAAGDTFLGYFVTGLTKGGEISRILNLASLAASLTCSKKGAASAIPSLDEVLSHAKSKGIDL